MPVYLKIILFVRSLRSVRLLVQNKPVWSGLQLTEERRFSVIHNGELQVSVKPTHFLLIHSL